MLDNEKLLVGHTLDVTDVMDILDIDVHELLDVLDEAGYLDESARQELLRACV